MDPRGLQWVQLFLALRVTRGRTLLKLSSFKNKQEMLSLKGGAKLTTKV